jgi:uncharacterized membrane-anchored protein YitT (DUF2179 family)
MIEKVVTYFEDHNVIIRGLALVLGCFICALVYTFFAVPNNIVYGGLGGLGIVVNKYTGISPVTFLNVCIGISLVLSIIILGFKHTLHSIIGYGVYILMVDITMPLANMVHLEWDSFLFACILFGILGGIGSGLIYRAGFDTGGIDTIITILRDKFKMTFGVLGNIVNGLIILSGVLTFGYIKAIYAIITLVIINYMTDAVLVGLSSKKMVFINSKKTKEVSKYISEDLDTGYTLLRSTNGIGIFKRPIIMCVIPTYRCYTPKHRSREIDSHETLYSHDCYNVVGGRTNQIVTF